MILASNRWILLGKTMDDLPLKDTNLFKKLHQQVFESGRLMTHEYTYKVNGEKKTRHNYYLSYNK